jgi:DNA-binding NtrC family response regulator
MSTSNKFRPKAYLIGLDEKLAKEIVPVLAASSCALTADPDKADIVFCGWQEREFIEASARCKRVPVVVVSRLPDVGGWLDALEAGAADYCAAPFEMVQMRWLLDTHLRRKRNKMAAA